MGKNDKDISLTYEIRQHTCYKIGYLKHEENTIPTFCLSTIIFRSGPHGCFPVPDSLMAPVQVLVPHPEGLPKSPMAMTAKAVSPLNKGACDSFPSWQICRKHRAKSKAEEETLLMCEGGVAAQGLRGGISTSWRSRGWAVPVPPSKNPQLLFSH